MSKLPVKIRQALNKEAVKWEKDIRGEDPSNTEQLIKTAEHFEASRPVRQPVSLRMDPFDISIIKRLARKKGLPHAQLMSMWLHERVEEEKQINAID